MNKETMIDALETLVDLIADLNKRSSQEKRVLCLLVWETGDISLDTFRETSTSFIATNQGTKAEDISTFLADWFDWDENA